MFWEKKYQKDHRIRDSKIKHDPFPFRGASTPADFPRLASHWVFWRKNPWNMWNLTHLPTVFRHQTVDMENHPCVDLLQNICVVFRIYDS